MVKSDAKIFVCENCGAEYSRWSGKCNNCDTWNSLVERQAKSKAQSRSSHLDTHRIKDVQSNHNIKKSRIKTDLKDLDAVLGGGFVEAGVYLLAGQPGAGKSTILLQISASCVKNQKKVLYISGEESLNQITSRSKRVDSTLSDLEVAVSNNADDIAGAISKGQYDLIIVDSIQTISTDAVGSSAGSISQVSNCAHILISAAKASKTTLIIVGHITKDGNIAGPKILEHLVDCVLQLEVETDELRFIRAIKNRYGPTSELAIFEMVETGLRLLKDPSQFLLSERTTNDGSVILATVDGQRPLLIEVQALVNKSNFGYPKRTAVGFDINRLYIIVAILEKHTKLKLQDADIYVNIVGGLRLKDPGADLAVAMAIASASTGYRLKDNAIVFGELGLTGEVRRVQAVDRRIKEAKSQAFDYAIGPKNDNKFVKSAGDIKAYLKIFLASS